MKIPNPFAPRPKYHVVPHGYRRAVSHAARDWSEALEWVRCYPESDPKPTVLDRRGREVRYER